MGKVSRSALSRWLYCTVLYCTVLYCTVPEQVAVLAEELGAGPEEALLAVHVGVIGLVPVGHPQVRLVQAPPRQAVVQPEALLHEAALRGQLGHGGGVGEEHEVHGLGRGVQPQEAPGVEPPPHHLQPAPAVQVEHRRPPPPGRVRRVVRVQLLLLRHVLQHAGHAGQLRV